MKFIRINYITTIGYGPDKGPDRTPWDGKGTFEEFFYSLLLLFPFPGLGLPAVGPFSSRLRHPNSPLYIPVFIRDRYLL